MNVGRTKEDSSFGFLLNTMQSCILHEAKPSFTDESTNPWLMKKNEEDHFCNDELSPQN